MLKQRRWRNKRYLAWVRSLPCSHCTAEPAGHAHHLIAVGDGIMGEKAPDSDSMPLCEECHRQVHADPHAYPQERWMRSTVSLALSRGVLRVGDW